MENGEFDIGTVVGKLMSDPKVAELIKGLKEENVSPAEVLETEKTDKLTGDMSEIYQKLPEIVNALSPLIGDGAKGKGTADSEKRNRLLAALKPYLSANRQSVIDSIMSYSKLTSLIDLLPGKNRPGT